MTATARFVLGGAVAGAAAGLVDGLGTWAAAGEGLGPLLVCSAAGALLGLPAGFGARLLVAAAAMGEEEGKEVWPGRLLSTAIALLLLAYPVLEAATIPVTRFVTLRYKLAGLLIVFAVSVTAAIFVVEALRPLIQRVIHKWLPCRSTPRYARRTAAWLACFGVPPFAVAAAVMATTDVSAALGWRPLLLGLAFALSMPAAVLWGIPRGATGRGMWVACAALAILAPATMMVPMSHSVTRKAVVGHGLLAPVPISFVWALMDGDGDGFAPHFGGGDCDDSDAKVHPMASDEAGNGVDEDCSGNDAAPIRAHRALPMVSTPLPEGVERPDRIVFITVEALRSDAIGEDMPKLRAFEQREALSFTEAYSACSATHLSFGGSMTGRYPSRIAWNTAVVPMQIRKLPPTFASELKQRGWRTDAFVSQWVHRHVPQLKRDFDRFETASEKGGSSQALLSKALERLERADPHTPHLLWIHFIEPHWPHQSGQTHSLESGYKAELRTVDSRIGRLLEALRRSPRWPRTAVVITGDHGEALGAHGVKTHGVTIYNSEVRVPLLVRAPGLGPGRLEQSVTHVDLAPTLLDLAGVKSKVPFDGRSLLGAMSGGQLEERAIFVESFNNLKPPQVWLAVVSGRWKLLRQRSKGLDELYDLSEDPGERRDLSTARPDVMERLKNHASSFAEAGTW